MLNLKSATKDKVLAQPIMEDSEFNACRLSAICFAGAEYITQEFDKMYELMERFSFKSKIFKSNPA